MERKIMIFCILVFLIVFKVESKDIKISKAELLDKIKGGWVGQMAGCAWGGPTEFQYNNVIIPEKDLPVWNSESINSVFSKLGDDVYVEIPFMEAMKKFGPNCDWNQMGDEFKPTEFELWHANYNGRENLRSGLKVPFSGHYLNNRSKFTQAGHVEHDDIDFQIEADFAGIVAPGMPNAALDIAWRAGHTMNWGNGVYGGVMVAAMHSVAYTAKSISEIVDAGRLSIPEGTRFRNMIEDVLKWKKEGKSFEENWRLITDQTKRTTAAGKGDPKDDLKTSDCDFIDVTQNGAYIILALIYGNGDFETSMALAMRGGCDSDCNPSSVAGILGNFIGFKAIPEKWKSGLDYNKVFPFTNYTLNDCIDLSYTLAKSIVKMTGGHVLNENKPGESFLILKKTIQPLAFEQCMFQKNSMGLIDTRLAIDNMPPVLEAQVVNQKGNKVSFAAKASDSDGVMEYCWFFGDLSFENTQNPSHLYKQPGEYHVICYVSDKLGYTSYQEITILIH